MKEQRVNDERIAKIYEKIEAENNFIPGPERERKASDAFGLKEPKVKRHLIDNVNRMSQFLGLLRSDEDLTPSETIFIVEFLALMVFNDKNCPLSEKEISEIKKKARDMYKELV